MDTDTEQKIEDIIRNRRFQVVYQPITRLSNRQVFGFEALARCKVPGLEKPITLYETASEVGKVGELGRAFRKAAIDQCPSCPLFLNLFPNEFEYGFLVRPDDAIFRHKKPIHVEITETVPINYFEQCQNVLSEIRKKGISLAIDDLGAGYSNLKYISDLAPDIVKLDRELVAGIAVGTRQFRLLRSIVNLCKSMGAKVVAEGVETRAELSAVMAAGVHFGQGYLFGMPAEDPPDPIWPDTTA